jgi:catechol 2,3-dioxygenase-like lactoylglutathione lyase family enzyme
MLPQHTPVATLPTRDLSRARIFYEDTLGFAPERESVAGVAYKSGEAMVFLYQS